MPKTWIIRADGGNLIDHFLEGEVGVSWNFNRDLKDFDGFESFKRAFEADEGRSRPQQAKQLWSFFDEMDVDDVVVAVDPWNRKLHIGSIRGGYSYKPHLQEQDLPPHSRAVLWESERSRDALKEETRTAIDRPITLFQVDGDVQVDLLKQE
jgi:predicted Mrr-cat superfamily restriction endonuclease